MSVDCITQLPEFSAGHTTIVVFVDRLSKMVHLAPCWEHVGCTRVCPDLCVGDLQQAWSSWASGDHQ